MRGQTVVVLVKTPTGTDGFNNPIYEWAVEATVDNVLVAPGSSSDLPGNLCPDGVDVNLSLHFPKVYTESLRGRRVLVGERTYWVIGDPQPYMDVNTPTDWDRPVDVTEELG